jgi:hypothetical protein
MRVTDKIEKQLMYYANYCGAPGWYNSDLWMLLAHIFAYYKARGSDPADFWTDNPHMQQAVAAILADAEFLCE